MIVFYWFIRYRVQCVCYVWICISGQFPHGFFGAYLLFRRKIPWTFYINVTKIRSHSARLVSLKLLRNPRTKSSTVLNRTIWAANCDHQTGKLLNHEVTHVIELFLRRWNGSPVQNKQQNSDTLWIHRWNWPIAKNDFIRKINSHLLQQTNSLCCLRSVGVSSWIKWTLWVRRCKCFVRMCCREFLE